MLLVAQTETTALRVCRNSQPLTRPEQALGAQVGIIAGRHNYRYAVEEDLLDPSQAVHVRRPRLD
jgi:hypothetical protein